MATCSLSIFFDAFDSTIISVVMPRLIDVWGLTKVETGLLGSAGFIGMLIGAILFGILADAVGRWRVFQITLLIYSILTGLCALSTGFATLFILRIMVGLGLGGLVPVVSTYLTEYIPFKFRGRFLSWFNAFFQLGNAFAYTVGLLIVVPFGWKWGFLIGVIPAIIVMMVQRYLPESLRFLLQKGRIEEAVRVVEKIEQQVLKRVTISYDEAVRNEKEGNLQVTKKVPISELFKGQVAKSTVMVSTLWFCLNFSTYALIMWLPVLLVKELKYGLALGFTFLIIAAVIGCLGQLTAGFASDILGRRLTITYSLLLYGCFAYLLFWSGNNTTWGYACLIIMWIFLGSSWGSVYAYSPENFPTSVRGSGVGFAGSIGRLGGILGPTAVGFIYSFAGIQWVLHVNMILLIIAVIFVLALGRETKSKMLEDIVQATK